MWLETEEERVLLGPELGEERQGVTVPAHQGKDKQETKGYKLSRDRGQHVIRSSCRWNSFQFQPHPMFSSFDLIFFHFYFLSLLKFMKARFISLPYLVLCFGTFLAQLIFCLYPERQFLLYCQVLTGHEHTGCLSPRLPPAVLPVVVHLSGVHFGTNTGYVQFHKWHGLPSQVDSIPIIPENMLCSDP